MTDKWQAVDTHGAGPPVQVPVLCRETIEACAKRHDAANLVRRAEFMAKQPETTRLVGEGR